MRVVILMAQLLFFLEVSFASDLCESSLKPEGEMTTKLGSWSRNFERYISFGTFYSLLSKHDSQYFLADVRSALKYDEYHIRGTFNFPGNSLLVMDQLKNKSIIIIGEGRSYRRLESLYASLLSKGFKDVKILDGGIKYWKYRVLGKGGAKSPEKLTTLDFLMSEDLSQWLIADYTSNGFAEDAFSSFDIYLPMKSRDDISILKSKIAAKSKYIKNILIVYDDLYGVEELLPFRQSLDVNVFVMDSSVFYLGVNQYRLRDIGLKYKQRTDGQEFVCD